MIEYFMVAGSRHLTDKFLVFDTMIEHCEADDTMLDGVCPTGADQLAYEIWHDIFHFRTERYPADWTSYGKRAAYLRDMQMMRKNPKFLLAFPLRGEENRGTKLAIKLADEANIPVIERWGNK